MFFFVRESIDHIVKNGHSLCLTVRILPKFAHTFKFKNTISKLNGQDVFLRMERQVENTNEYAIYKEEVYKVKVMFEAEW